MNAKVFVDTNLIVYLYLEKGPEKRNIAYRMLMRVLQNYSAETQK